MQTATTRSDALSSRPAGRGPALNQLFSRISDLSRLDIGAQQLLRLNRDSDDLNKLQVLIQSDPSLVAQILRRVNSPYYNLDTKVKELSVAARLLGFREFSNLAFAVYLSRMFTSPVSFATFSLSGLWAHSVAVASTAQLISRVCGRADPAQAFMAGLLHDIGLLMCYKQMRQRFMGVVERIQNRTMTTRVEQDIYSFDHAQLGAHVTKSWGLASSIVEAVSHHHDVESHAAEQTPLVYVVATANYFSSRAGWTSLGVHNVALPPDHAYHSLGLDQVALSIIWKELAATLEKSGALAEL